MKRDSRLKLVVFDLDFTLWDAGGVWCDCLSAPFRSVDGRVLDSRDDEVVVYPDAYDVMDELDESGVPMALASRTNRPDWAEELLRLLGLIDRFVLKEIYPSSKTRHFGRLRQITDLAYTDMLFFDDEHRNISEVGALGVRTVHIANGFKKAHYEAGLELFE